MAGIELKQQLKLQQQLVMTPHLQLAIKLLQMSRLELIDTVRAELEENPVLEEDLAAQEPEASAPSAETAVQEPSVDAEEPEVQESDSAAASEIDWDKYLENYANQPPTGGGIAPDAEDAPPLDATVGAPTTLADHLRWQMQMVELSDEERHFLDLVIGSLDKDGYLRDVALEDLAEEAGLDPEDAEEVLKILQGFDPVGVGARDLRECLLAQVDAYDLDIDVRTVVDRHLPNLEKRNYKAIAKDLELDLEDVYEVAKIIATLEPRPARNFVTDSPRFITPDVYVHKVGDKYFVVPNDDGLPRLKIANFFRSAMDADSDAREYVQNKMRSAQWLIRSIDQRRRTITRVTECIVEKQRDFFEKGINHLKPMVLRDVAEAVGIHESTVSRVTTNKYVQTPRGLFELKYFFNASIRRESADDIASESVRNRVREIIEAEDPKRPLSDQKIAALLKEEGIVIARRTVAKYRESLGILSSGKRKKLF